MEDREIIKALELCSADECWCDDCPYENLCTDTDITKFALDLINRQKSEIERLERHTEMYHEVRVEAVKEFAERLKEKLHLNGAVMGSNCAIVNDVDIDNLVKEMVGAE